MSLKILVRTAVLLALLSVSAFAQQHENDKGLPDSMYMVVHPLEEGGNDSTFIAELFVYIDSQTVGSASAGFTWDNPRVQMDSAVFSPESEASFDFVKFAYRNNILDSTNFYQVFQFAGSRIFGSGLVPSPDLRLACTYYFHITDWDPLEDVCIDTLKFSTGTSYTFVDANGNIGYIPYWTGRQCASEAPTPGTLVLSEDTLKFTAEEGAVGVATQTFTVTEAEARALDYTSSTTASWNTLLSPNGTTPGTVTVRPMPSGLAAGTYTDSVTVASAGAENSPSVVIQLEITQPNQAPVIAPRADTTIDEGQALALTVTATDPDGTTPSLTHGVLPVGATWVDGGATGTLNWTPDFTQGGSSYDVVFIASDGDLTDEDTVTITVNNVNRPPVLDEIGPKVVAEEALLSFTATATDPDVPAPTLTFTAEGLPAGASITAAGAFAWTPTRTQSGFYDVLIIVSDGEAADSETVAIEVTDIDGFALTPDTLYFTAILGGPNPGDKGFNIALSDETAVPVAVSDLIPWATIDPETGTTPVDVTVSIDIAGLAVGTYFDSMFIDQVLVTAGGEEIVPVYEYISLEVLEPAKLLVVAPDTLKLVQSEGAATAASGDFAVSEIGATAIDFAVSTASTWLTLDPTSGTTPGVVTATVNSTAIDPGDYLDSIQVTSGDADNSPVWAYVALEVIPCPVLQPDFVEYNAEIFAGATALVERTIIVTSNGLDQINWTTTQAADYFTFIPASGNTAVDTMVSISYSRMFAIAGEYSDTAYIATADDPANECYSETMIVVNVTVNREPSADTVIVVNTPAVAGMRVAVPVIFSNSCPLNELGLNLSWPGTDIFLDSVSFAGSAVEYVDNRIASIDNDAWTVMIGAATETQAMIPIGSQELLATLHFSLTCEIVDGSYPISLSGLGGDPVYFVRDCGEGVSTEVPEYIMGNIIVGEASNFVCGYVVDPDGVEIEGATVELFADFPFQPVEMTTTTSFWGSFGFEGIMSIPFDLYAYADGYYPNTAEDLNFGEKGVVIVLTPIQELVETSEQVDYYCPDMSNLFLGAPIPIGAVVEAFTQDGLLVGQKVVSNVGQYGFMPVYRAWDLPEDAGAETGDRIDFFINQMPAVATGDVIYPAEYAQMEVCLEVRGTVERECTLFEGWNLISWNVNTDTDDILTVLAPVMDYVDVVLGFDQGGLTFDPDLQAFSTLWNVDHLSGYWVRIEGISEVTLSLTGLPVIHNTPIPLTAGWNLVSYLPEEGWAIDDALASVAGNIVFAYGFPDGGVQIWEPSGTFSQLGTMDPCNGYWLKVENDGVLIYDMDVVPPTPVVASAAKRTVSSSSNWVNLYSENLTVDGEMVNAGTVIKALSVDGDRELGSFTLATDGQFGFMPVYADAAGEDQFGLQAGDNFYLTVDDIKTDEVFEWSANGARVEINTLAASGAVDNVPMDYSLDQNYPNPFNPTTTIMFTMPAAGNAKIEVFNVLGRLIATPFDGEATVGSNQVVWDGRSSRGDMTASGVYFYRLTADNYTETRKMMLLK
ncbi:MAG: T9SS type A sorting domain-containing protein [bacterium]|nr:T9SS type A sorting domain-containing protein [bacterium]